MQGNLMSRQSFVRGLGILGVANVLSSAGAPRALAADADFPELKQGQPSEACIDVETGEVTINKDVIVRYSTCLGCYSSCGIG